MYVQYFTIPGYCRVSTQSQCTVDPWELLYGDDLVLIPNRIEELSEKLERWEGVESKGLTVNIGKTKIMLRWMRHRAGPKAISGK